MADIEAVYKQYALPNDTRVSALRDLPQCKNLGLILDKFQPWCYCRLRGRAPGWELGFEYIDNHGSHQNADGSEAKSYWLNEDLRYHAADEDKYLKPNTRLDEALFEKYKTRWMDRFSEKPFALCTLTRMVIGLGGKGTLEMGITLHHTYGFPYIPGSALKGVARTCGLLKIADLVGVPRISSEDILRIKEDKKKTPLQILDGLMEMPLDKDTSSKFYQEQYAAMERVFEQELKDQTLRFAKSTHINKITFADLIQDINVMNFREIFGTMADIGKVVFYEAIPYSVENIFTTEIMTPHFSEYYEENRFPQEDQKLKTLAYLAINENIWFLFGLAPRYQTKTNKKLVALAKSWLKSGLKESGVGGKTSSGMGRFYIPRSR
jgi:CRISPR-associated protein Cmr6